MNGGDVTAGETRCMATATDAAGRWRFGVSPGGWAGIIPVRDDVGHGTARAQLPVGDDAEGAVGLQHDGGDVLQGVASVEPSETVMTRSKAFILAKVRLPESRSIAISTA